VSIGNPQCAIRVADVDALRSLELHEVGPPIESHPEFPNRTNVSWYTELDASGTTRIGTRIFERGVGETLSSGTGACGAAIAYALERAPSAASSPGATASALARPMRITVVLDGGELEVEVDEQLRVHLSGWALPVFAGTLSEEFVSQLEELA
jgi:diaminopimelate epimerase